jgi:hypothetical protein
MFDSLSERLQGVLGELRSHGKLSGTDVDKAMREIRLALLEADVNFRVVGGGGGGGPRRPPPPPVLDLSIRHSTSPCQ